MSEQLHRINGKWYRKNAQGHWVPFETPPIPVPKVVKVRVPPTIERRTPKKPTETKVRRVMITQEDGTVREATLEEIEAATQYLNIKKRLETIEKRVQLHDKLREMEKRAAEIEKRMEAESE